MGEEESVGAVGGDEDVRCGYVGVASQYDVHNLVEVVSTEMDGTVGEDAEAEHHLDFEASGVVIAKEAKRRIVGEGGDFERMAFELRQLGEDGHGGGVESAIAPALYHVVKGAVRFNLYEEVVELVAELLVVVTEGCGHIKASREVEVGREAEALHVEGVEDHGVCDGAFHGVVLESGDELFDRAAAKELDVGKVVCVAQKEVGGASGDNCHGVTFEAFKVGEACLFDGLAIVVAGCQKCAGSQKERGY